MFGSCVKCVDTVCEDDLEVGKTTILAGIRFLEMNRTMVTRRRQSPGLRPSVHRPSRWAYGHWNGTGTVPITLPITLYSKCEPGGSNTLRHDVARYSTPESTMGHD
jgi:hypothetical protein